MGIWKKMGKTMGHAIVKAGKTTAAAIKRKNLQNRVEKMILEKFNREQLKKIIKDYNLPGPELPERGYYKKSDYVNYAYHHLKLKTVIQWAQRHKIKIKDIMDYYITEMEKIDRQYGKTKAEDKEQGVEEIEVKREDFETSRSGVSSKSQYSTPSSLSFESEETNVAPKYQYSQRDPYDEIINHLEGNLQSYVSQFKYTDEEEFRKTVFGFLSPYLRKHKIITPPNTSSMGDIVIDDGEIILELKYANNVSTLNQGLNEVMDYQKKGKRVVMILLDVNEMNPQKLRNYESKYLKLGAYKVITVKGGRRFKRKKRKYTPPY